MESFYVLITTDMINSMKEFVNYNIPLDDQTKFNQNIQNSSISNDLELNIPPPSKSISQYKQLQNRKSSFKETTTNDQRISF